MIFWSLFGPFLIWLALVGHVVYQVKETWAQSYKTTVKLGYNELGYNEQIFGPQKSI